MIKAVFFDIDGTLADERTHQMRDDVRAALLSLKDSGIRLFIATGRHRLEIDWNTMLGGLSFDGSILLNGQYCTVGDEIIHRMPIDPDDIKNLLCLLKTRRFPCAFLEGEVIYINYVDEFVLQEQKKINAPIPPVMDISRALDHEVYQLIPFITRDMEEMLLASIPHCLISRWSDTVTDVVPAGGGKEQGMKKILNHFSIAREETMAFGDGVNDISMLRFAGIGIAMGNGKTEVKQTADYVTADLNDGGICKALRHFNLIDSLSD